MLRDIYGNVLKPGYCEFHPHINELYPCRQCYSKQEDIDYEVDNDDDECIYEE